MNTAAANSRSLSLETAVPRIREYLRLQRWDDAIAAANEALAESPANRDLWYMLAVGQRYSQRVPEALASLERLEAFHPRYPRLFQERGHCYVTQRDAARAIAAFEQAVHLNPALPASWTTLQTLYRMSGRPADSANAAKNVANLQSMPPEIVTAYSMYADGELVQSEQLVRRYLLERGDHVEGMRLLAKIGIEQDILDDAEFLLESVLEMSPDHHVARFDYAVALLKQHKHPQAQKEIEKLLALDPDNRICRTTQATIWLGLGQVDRAILAYRELLAETPGDPELHLSIGHALKTSGASAEAIEAYREAARLQPRFGEASWSLANLKTYRFTGEELDRMRRHESEPTTQMVDQYHLCFALGKALEDRAEYAESFSYYERGNAIKKRECRYHPGPVEQNTRLQKAVCTREFFAARSGVGSPDRSPIFIVGLPRSGSTLLEQILASHSQVEGTMELAEIPRLVGSLQGRYVDRDTGDPQYPGVLARLTPDDFLRFGERYLADSRHYRGDKPRFVDKMPNNFRHLGLIHLILPNAKIIDARREAVACCFSNFKQLFASGQQFTYSVEDITHYYRTYLDLMNHWDAVLPGKILQVRHEDVVDDLQTQVRRILEYCEIEFEPACLDFHKTDRRVHTASSEQVRQPLNREGLDQWRHYEPWLTPLRQALADVPRDARPVVARSAAPATAVGPSESTPIKPSAIEPSPVELTIAHIRDLAKSGLHAAALHAAETLVAEVPENRDVLYWMALCLRHLERIPEALTVLERLERFRPWFSKLFHERGCCYIALRDAPRAIDALLRAVNINPALPASWSLLEGLCRKTGDTRNADTATQHVATLKALPHEVIQATSLFSDGELAPAENIIRAFLLEHGDHVEAMRLLARIGMARDVLDDAELLLDAVLTLAPDYRAARHDYAQVLVERHKYVQAREQLDQLLESDPDNRNYRALYATACVGLGEHEKAIPLYRELLPGAPAPWDLHLSIAHAQKTVGRRAEAIVSYRAAAAARANFGDAYWSLANLKTYRFLDQEIERMRDAVDAPPTLPADRFHLCFALGKAYEDRGEYALSWQFYERGNALKRAESRYRPEVIENNTRRQIQVCTGDFFAARSGFGTPEWSPIFIVGLPRAGSTLVEQILASHSLIEGTQELPDIQRMVLELQGRDPNLDDPRYPGVLADMKSEDFLRLGEKYLADTRVYRSGRAFFIDKMPNNFRHIGLIHLMLPNAKIIDARRESMACCWSNLKQLFANGQEFTYSIGDIARYYLTYLELMRHWDGVLPGRILRVHHEDVVADLPGSVRRILAHCGLEFEPACVEFHKTERSIRTASSEQVRLPIFRDGLDQWKHFEPWLAPLKEALGGAADSYRS